MKKFLPLVILLGLIVAGVVNHWWHARPSDFSGTLEMTEYALGSRVAGRLQDVFVTEGAYVPRGAVIATFERYTKAKADCERSRDLYAQGGLDQQSLEEAELALSDQVITAPVDGVILNKIYEQGEVVLAGSPVVILGNVAEWWVKIYIPEHWINRVKVGDMADIRFDGLEQVCPGHVVFIAPQAEFTPRNVQTPEERATQTFAVKIALDKTDVALHPGVVAHVRLRSL